VIGSSNGEETQRSLSGGGGDFGSGAVQHEVVLVPGTYTVKAQFRRVSGSGTFQIAAAQLAALARQGPLGPTGGTGPTGPGGGPTGDTGPTGPAASAPYGSLYVSTPASAGITSGTPAKLGGTTALDPSSGFSMPVDGRLRNDGSTRTFRVEAGVSATSDTGNIVLSLFIAKGGTEVASSEQQRKIGTGSDVGNMEVVLVVQLATNEYVEVFGDVSAGTVNVTAQKMYLTVTAID
jgi:hypothetical protein